MSKKIGDYSGSRCRCCHQGVEMDAWSLWRSPAGSVKTNFSILFIVKKLKMRLQIVCALRRRCGSATRPRLSKMHHHQRKESAVCHQAEPGGYEDDLGGGQTSCDQRPLRRRLLAVVGAHRKYIGGKFWGNTFFWTRNSFCFISFVSFDFDCTTLLYSYPTSVQYSRTLILLLFSITECLSSSCAV